MNGFAFHGGRKLEGFAIPPGNIFRSLLRLCRFPCGVVEAGGGPCGGVGFCLFSGGLEERMPHSHLIGKTLVLVVFKHFLFKSIHAEAVNLLQIGFDSGNGIAIVGNPRFHPRSAP